MDKKTITLVIGVLAALAAATILGVATLYFREQQVKLEAEKTAIQKAIADAAQQTRALNTAVDASKQIQQEQLKLDAEKAVGQKAMAVDAAEQTRALNNAVDSSKQYQEEQQRRAARVRTLSSGVIAAQGAKAAMTEFFQSEGKWPENNGMAGLPAPESYQNEFLQSVGVERFEKSARVRIRYASAAGDEQLLFLIANMNGAGQVLWNCVSPNIKDIGTVMPGCRFQ